MDYQILGSTEIVDLASEKSNEQFVQLPKYLQMHCLVKINDNQVLLVGGLSPDGPEAKTYLFDFNTLTWHDGPDLGYPRGASINYVDSLLQFFEPPPP